eukprot:jgi/Psemu1/303855/fgenesh1_kg.126_\
MMNIESAGQTGYKGRTHLVVSQLVSPLESILVSLLVSIQMIQGSACNSNAID